MPCKIWGIHGGDFWDKRNQVRTSQETHNFSATDPSRLMLYKIGSVHGDDYEECCLLRYKNPVRTSQETHYGSALRAQLFNAM
jgi:hypothetical protein